MSIPMTDAEWSSRVDSIIAHYKSGNRNMFPGHESFSLGSFAEDDVPEEFKEVVGNFRQEQESLTANTKNGVNQSAEAYLQNQDDAEYARRIDKIIADAKQRSNASLDRLGAEAKRLGFKFPSKQKIIEQIFSAVAFFVVTNLLEPLIKFIGELIQKIKELLEKVFAEIGKFFTNLGSEVSNFFNNLFSGGLQAEN